MNVKKIGFELGRHARNVRSPRKPFSPRLTNRQGMNGHSLDPVGFGLLAHRKQVHIVARRGQGDASAVEHAAIISRVSAAKMTNSHAQDRKKTRHRYGVEI